MLVIIFVLPIVILAILFVTGCSTISVKPDSSSATEAQTLPKDFIDKVPEDKSDDETQNPSEENINPSESTDSETQEDNTDVKTDSETQEDNTDVNTDSETQENPTEEKENSENQDEQEDKNKDVTPEVDSSEKESFVSSKFQINITTFEEKFSYKFSNDVISKIFDENSKALYLRFELLENGSKVSGARFEILTDCESVSFDVVNYNSVYILLSKVEDFDFTIKVVGKDVERKIHVDVS